MAAYWVSWVHSRDLGPFLLNSPWWVSGSTVAGATICAAVSADSEQEAKDMIVNSFDIPVPSFHVAWRFITAKPDNWSPFSSRFERAAWMRWPSVGGEK
jgi:hypothetical protein